MEIKLIVVRMTHIQKKTLIEMTTYSNYILNIFYCSKNDNFLNKDFSYKINYMKITRMFIIRIFIMFVVNGGLKIGSVLLTQSKNAKMVLLLLLLFEV